MTIGMPGKPRIFVKRSEMLLAGVELTFTVSINKEEITQEHVRECLEWGKLCGFGEWRHGGFGRFELINVEPAW